MKTFTEPKVLVEDLHYQDQRQKCLTGLKDGMIDKPIIELVNALNRLPHCFTLQSCYGHFIYYGQPDPHNLEPLPITTEIDIMEYRIAYMALRIENSNLGKMFFNTLKEITVIDPLNLQFCCAEWFWKRQVNSYALQVEPDRFKYKDKALLS